jgi:hypothetical protein
VIAIAAIAAFSFFGKTVKDQTAGIALSLGGDQTDAAKQVSNAKTDATSAGTAAGKADGLQDYVKSAGGTSD